MTKAADEVRETGFDADVYVPALLTNLANVLASTGSTFYRRNFGIGLTDWRIMYRLAAQPWITAHQVCVLATLDKGVVSRSIALLEERGLVAVESDAADARRRRIALTQAGHALYGRMVSVALARERNFVSVLSPAELATLVGLLQRLIGNLDAFSRAVPIPSGPPGAQAPKRRGKGAGRP